MSKYGMELTLACCQSRQFVVFDSFESPFLAEGVYRKSITCKACESYLIVDCDATEEIIKLQQEIVALP